MIALFHMADSNFGGFVTYTAHLYRALIAAGHDTRMFKVRTRVEDKVRIFTHGVPYQNVSPDAARHIAQTHPTIVTCCYWRNSPEGTEALLSGGAALVLHDPTELVPELLALIAKHRPRVIAIRRNNVAFFNAKGIENVTFVPHPYVPVASKRTDSAKYHAVAACRVDFDKYTHEIVSANKLVSSPAKRVRIYGVANRLYVFHKLIKLHPDWETHYHGDFPKTEHAAVDLLSKAKFSVDLSRIAGDGGGTQYSFLEAWNAGCHLIVHSGWIRPDGELVPGVNCTAVSSPEELAHALEGEPDEAIVREGLQTMRAHGPDVIVPELLKVIR